MDNSTKIRLIRMLDREFDKTIESIFNKQKLMERTRDSRAIAQYASAAAELEDYANTLFIMAQKILGA